MKVIVANWVYNWGSTGFILRDVCLGLQHLGINAVPIAATTVTAPSKGAYIFAHDLALDFYSRMMRLGWPKFWGSSFATSRIISFIKRENPDIVHLHLLHCASCNLYSLLKWLGKNNIKTIITHHAELYYTGSCEHSYGCTKFINRFCKECPNVRRATGAIIGGNPHKNWLRMKKAFAYFKKDDLLFTAVSPWVKTRLELSPICNRFECDVVMNGVDTSVFYHRDIPQRAFVLYVSARFDPQKENDNKGGWFLVMLAKQLPELRFVVVSSSSINCDNLPSNVYLLGKAKNQDELADLYSSAALTVTTSRRETFSMVCAESLCCGTPIVGFKAGGPESIAIMEFSKFVDYGDLNSLKAVVMDFIKKPFVRTEISHAARQVFSKEAMAKGYLEAYKKVLSR